MWQLTIPHTHLRSTARNIFSRDTLNELENVNGGGFFDFIEDAVEIAKDFVVDTVQNMKAPAQSIAEFIAEGLSDKLAGMLYDILKKIK